MNYKKRNTSIEELFINGLNLNPENMEIDKPYLVEEANVGIQTLNKENKKIFSRVIRAIRKSKRQMYKIVLLSGDTLRGAHNHKIGVMKNEKVEWVSLEEIYKLKDSFNLPIITSSGLVEFLTIDPDGEDYPLDIEVENEHSYFSSGILSHNTMYGPDFKATGGRAPAFYSSWSARVTRTGDILGVDKELKGIEVKVRNIKNKVGIPKRDASLKLIFAGGIDSEEEYVNYLKLLGLIEQKGAYYSNPNWVADDGTTGMKVCGLEKVKDYLKENPKLYSEIKDQVNQLITKHTALDDQEQELSEEEKASNAWSEVE